MAENPHASIVFNWLELHRQVRVEGLIEKVPEAMSTEYFQSRPKGSQIGAWASPQSRVIPHREILEENVRELQARYQEEEKLPRPEHWGGYRLLPHTVEFWQGRSSRLHDRIRYILKNTGAWEVTRLAP
jgi:pyridoxamine 5'-phosphate oxidase